MPKEEGLGLEYYPATPVDVMVARVSDEAINFGWEWRIRALTQLPTGTHAWAVPFKDEYLDDGLRNAEVQKIISEHQPMFGPKPSFRFKELSKINNEDTSVPIVKGEEYLVFFRSFNDDAVSAITVGKVKYEEDAQWQTL